MKSPASSQSDAPSTARTGSGAAILNRRSFVKRVLTAGAASTAVGLSSKLRLPEANAATGSLTVASASQRRMDAYRIRQEAALSEFNLPLPAHSDNGDEALYPNKTGNFSKGLPHNQLGEVDLNAY